MDEEQQRGKLSVFGVNVKFFGLNWIFRLKGPPRVPKKGLKNALPSQFLLGLLQTFNLSLNQALV